MKDKWDKLFNKEKTAKYKKIAILEQKIFENCTHEKIYAVYDEKGLIFLQCMQCWKTF